jgi:hypothetical protein
MRHPRWRAVEICGQAHTTFPVLVAGGLPARAARRRNDFAGRFSLSSDFMPSLMGRAQQSCLETAVKQFETVCVPPETASTANQPRIVGLKQFETA